MPKLMVEISNRAHVRKNLLPPRLTHQKLSLTEFAHVLIERTLQVNTEFPNLPLSLVKDIIFAGMREEFEENPNIEVIFDVLDE